MNDPTECVRNPRSLDLVKLAFQRLKIPEHLIHPSILAGDCDHAGGDVVCQRCGLEYRDHPVVQDFEWLTVVCDWRVYEL